MNITVRLYKLHDYDLIYLYKNLSYPVRDAMKKSLSAYVRNNPLFLKIPVEKPDKENLSNIKNAQFHLKLDEKEDADLILYLSGLKKYYRNSFLKNLLRGYLAGPAVFVYEAECELEKSKARQEAIENNLLEIKSLNYLKQRKKKKKTLILDLEQKKFLDSLGVLKNTNMEVAVHDRYSNKN